MAYGNIESKIGDLDWEYCGISQHHFSATNIVVKETTHNEYAENKIVGKVITWNSYHSVDTIDPIASKEPYEFDLEITCNSIERVSEVLNLNLNDFGITGKEHDSDLHQDILGGGVGYLYCAEYAKELKVIMVENHFNRIVNLLENNLLKSLIFRTNFLNLYTKTTGSRNVFFVPIHKAVSGYMAVGVVEDIEISHSQATLD